MAITYTPATNFGAKDSLPTNDPAKVIKGSEFTTEFAAIQSSFNLAAPTASPTFTGTSTFDNIAATGTSTLTAVDINGGTIDGVTLATSDVTVGAGKTLDVSAGTLTLANDQISGDSIEGGTIGSVTITSVDINGGSMDAVTIGAATAAEGTFTTVAASALTVNTDTLYVDSGTSRVGIENASPSYTLEVTGEAVATQGMPYIAESGTSRTLAFSDIGNYIRCTNAAATTVTIPPNASVTIPTGAEVIIFQAGAGQVTIAAGAGVTLNSKEGNLKISAQYAAATCKKVATDTWDVIGDLSA